MPECIFSTEGVFCTVKTKTGFRFCNCVFFHQVCKRCFDVGPQTFGAARPLLREFRIWRERKKADRNNNHKDVPIQPLNDVKEESQRLVQGYTKHISNSKIKSFVLEAFSFVKIPDWQKSKYWLAREQ